MYAHYVLPSTPKLRVVNHSWNGCSCSCGITREVEGQFRGGNWGGNCFNTIIQSKQANNHYNFPWAKNLNLWFGNQPHHHTGDKIEKKPNYNLVMVDCNFNHDHGRLCKIPLKLKRKGIIVYKRTSHPSNIKAWPWICLLLIHLKWARVNQFNVFKTNSNLGFIGSND